MDSQEFIYAQEKKKQCHWFIELHLLVFKKKTKQSNKKKKNTPPIELPLLEFFIVLFVFQNSAHLK